MLGVRAELMTDGCEDVGEKEKLCMYFIKPSAIPDADLRCRVCKAQPAKLERCLGVCELGRGRIAISLHKLLTSHIFLEDSKTPWQGKICSRVCREEN